MCVGKQNAADWPAVGRSQDIVFSSGEIGIDQSEAIRLGHQIAIDESVSRQLQE